MGGRKMGFGNLRELLRITGRVRLCDYKKENNSPLIFLP
jgi:hypothetical protein